MKGITALVGLAVALALLIGWELVPGRHDDLTPAAGGPPAAADAQAPRRPVTDAPSIPPEQIMALSEKIVARPLFSPTRRPPDSAPATSAAAQVTEAKDELPRLTGVLFGPSGGRAIFSGRDGKSRAAGVGDEVGAFRIQEIAPGQVTLSGSEGERMLHPTYIPSTRTAPSAAPSSGMPAALPVMPPPDIPGLAPPGSPAPFVMPYRARSTR
jgi:hypothetical protein